jgi:hypothetical protein
MAAIRDAQPDADLLPSEDDGSTPASVVPMGEPVSARALTVDRRVVIAVAAAVAVEHLLIGTHLPADSWAQHSRSVEWALIATATVILMILVRRVSIGCWLVLGGAAANVISWAEHGSVPDYMGFVVGDRWIAFNLADVSIVIGALVVLAGSAVRAEQALRRRSRA